MYLKKMLIKNYRTLRDTKIIFNEHLNIVVGDNECGKSSLLEAINLVISGQINGRSIQNELHPYLFNGETVNEYINALRTGDNPEPPKILIELYLQDRPEFARLVGTINSLKENSPGISLTIEFNEEFSKEYQEYIKNPNDIRTIPIEYYKVVRHSFDYGNITARSIPIKPILIDASSIRHNFGANKYVVDIIKDILSSTHQAQLALSYRKMKDSFLEDDIVKSINTALGSKQGSISNKKLSVSLDTTAKATWEAGVMPHLDDIPMPLVGKGEQSSVKIKLAIESSAEAHIYLIEEPENHLSFHNLNKLLKAISEQAVGKQLVITTHSSFVMNKLGVENVLLFNGKTAITLNDLSDETKDYFLKLPGHDTLRLILSQRAILVEGASDELIVQKAFIKHHGCRALEKDTDIISVNSLAFKRFLEIAYKLSINTAVVRDNDGDFQSNYHRYDDFIDEDTIKVFIDNNESCRTLEHQILNVNDYKALGKILGKDFLNQEEALEYMLKNKTEYALAIFNSQEYINFPEYINEAVK